MLPSWPGAAPVCQADQQGETTTLFLILNQISFELSRKKKAPPKLVELEEETSSRSARKKSIQKPRYH